MPEHAVQTPGGAVSGPPRALTRRDRRRMQEGALVRILTVCTGNVCRSPVAATVLAARLADLPVVVHSAGTHAPVGTAITPQAGSIAARAGADAAAIETHRARYLVEPMLAEADLVLGMTADHRDTVVQLMPRKQRQVLTVREFAARSATLTDDEITRWADSAGAIPAQRVAAVVAAVAQSRVLAEAKDVIDPYRQSDAVYTQMANELLPAIDEVARVIRLALRG
ncbi:low molecular weight phosphatase family protein [Microbacterium esteraromaticum]|uniref:arsenate reductase/protein-tyrosine-phosphatase family protein n=1 Tax=Microbacterium esteraromaticum TaxID=57043 RepID=UPI001C95BB3B|nr:low molecular weight phosphatase family protein [Microbacterium esteraromaticum]MBY6060288.1 low molecular weight phosphatase family protein [Microbacterium esteraromaticum]